MKSNRSVKFYVVTALMLLLSMFLVACGDPTATTAPATTAAATTAAATATKAATTTAATTTTLAAATTAVAATTTAATTAAGNADKPLVIGMIVSRTGALSIYGKMLEDSWPLALEYYTKGTNKIAGRTIKVVVEDDASDANKSVEAARKLVQQDKVDIIVGVQSSAAAIAVAAINDKELKKVFIVDAAADSSITGTNFSRYTFRTGRNTDQDAVAGASLAVDIASKKNKKIASMFQDYAFGQGGNASWKEIATKTAGVQWTEIAVPLAATDFTPYVQKLLDAAPDVFVLNWAGTTTAKLAQTLKDNDVFSKMILVSSIADFKVSIKSLGDAAIGFQGVGIYWHQFPKNAENDYLVKSYKDKYNTYPDIFDQDGMNLVSALSAALEKTGGDTDPEKLIPAMEGLSFKAPKGTLTFRKEDHQALQPMYLVELKKDPAATFGVTIPTLIKELSPEESAPPIRRK